MTDQELDELERRARRWGDIGVLPLIAALREAWQAQEDDALHEKLYANLAAERDALRAKVATLREALARGFETVLRGDKP